MHLTEKNQSKFIKNNKNNTYIVSKNISDNIYLVMFI